MRCLSKIIAATCIILLKNRLDLNQTYQGYIFIAIPTIFHSGCNANYLITIFFTSDKNNSCTKVHTVESATGFALKLSNEAENLIRSITRIAMANTGN